MKLSLWSAIVLIVLACSFARADVGMMLDSPIGVGATAITGAGHASVYFSRVCPASPVKLRKCAPGEQGSVLSNYNNFNESHPYEWNIVPLSVFCMEWRTRRTPSSWIEFTDAAGAHRVGLTRETILSGRSDHAAAVKLLLARMDAVLHDRKKYP